MTGFAASGLPGKVKNSSNAPSGMGASVSHTHGSACPGCPSQKLTDWPCTLLLVEAKATRKRRRAAAAAAPRERKHDDDDDAAVDPTIVYSVEL